MQFLSLLIVTALSAESMSLRVHQGTKSLPVTEDRIDLVPPQYESISQYNQPQTLSQVLGIKHQQFIQPIVQQQGPVTPFLYLGPLLYSNNLKQLNHQENQRENSRADQEENTENTYVIYRPTSEEENEFVELSPPSIKQEPNYYSLKPRKFKKFQEAESKKQNIPKSNEDLKQRIKIADDELSEQQSARDLSTASSDDYEIKESPPTSRLDFQMHGHKGPKSYKFGYDTGENSKTKRQDRQFRVEERNEAGDVIGRYGYYDRKGKLRVVNYTSTAKDGFKVL